MTAATCVPRVCRAGSAADPPRAVLLHGLGGKPEVWQPFVERAPSTWELWDVGLPWESMAGSSWAHTGSAVDVLLEVFADHSFDVVIAHSFAANLLTEANAAGRLGECPAVLVSPFYRSRPEDFDWATIAYYLNEFHRTFIEALSLGDSARFPEPHREWMARGLREQVGPYGWMRFFETYLRSPFLELSSITGERLVVTGEQDIAAGPVDGRALAEHLPHGRFALLEECGHFPMVQDPDGFARAVSDFLDTLTRRRGQHDDERAWS